MVKLPKFAGTAIFVLSMVVLMLEVALTRIFSVMTYNHFTYLIIGLALLGFGASGTALTIGARFRNPRSPTRVLAECAWLLGLIITLAFLAITRTSFNSMAVYEKHDFSQLLGLLLMLILAAAPFFAGGLCIGFLISASGDEINRIYFLDLMGAGIGALLSVFAINYIGATSTIFALSLAAFLVAILVDGFAEKKVRWRYVVTALLPAALLVVTLISDSYIPVPFEPSKGMPTGGGDHKWHVVARVDVTPSIKEYPGFGGALSRTYDQSHPPIDIMGIWQDGAAFTGIVKLKDKQPRDEPILDYYMQACPYILRPGAKSLVIGSGGGVDIAIALKHGCPHVTAVDINPWTVRFVRDKYADYAGGLYSRPDVDVVVAEGRHFLTATDQKFDVIQLSGVDTFSALAAGAYALSENYLYTREAISDCMNTLTDDGVLSFSRWLFYPPRESIRLALTAREALEAQGVTDPEKHIMVLAAPAWEGRSPWADIIIKKRAFMPEEVARLRAWAGPLRFDVIYDPLLPYVEGGPFDRLQGTSKYNPSGSAREFSRVLRAPSPERGRYLAEYPYQIRPATDDSPFFFNYYKLSNLRHPLSASLGGDPVNRLPLGLIVLIACLVQVTVMGAIFIVLPMRNRAAGLGGHAGATAVLAYFGAIGLAFIAAEIMLLQKLTVFLGGPVYSMAITLFSLLVFCGLGSFLAKRFTRIKPADAGILILGLLVVTILATTMFLNHVLPSLMGLPQIMRVAVTMITLLPIGLLMGMPFPTGVRMASQLHEPFVAWGWCVNASATVVGSVGSVLVAMFTGFTVVLYLAMGLYAVAGLALMLARRASTGGVGTDRGAVGAVSGEAA